MRNTDNRIEYFGMHWQSQQSTTIQIQISDDISHMSDMTQIAAIYRCPLD